MYGVAEGEKVLSLGPIGLDGKEVFTIPGEGLCAIVHGCPATPYQSTDENTVIQWVRTHQSVLDEAQKKFGTVIPMSFDTILQSKNEAVSPDQAVRDWLKEEAGRLLSLMERIRGRDEYGVQIFYTPRVIASRIAETNPEIRQTREEMTMRSPGVAYLLRQKVEKAVRAEMERRANDWFKDYYARIKRHCADIVVEKTGRTEGSKIMLLNLSCLVTRDMVKDLGAELEDISNTEGLTVHFSGPWPPYSFVARPAIPVGEVVR